VAVGFATLEANEYGLDYSWISKTISTEVKTSGFYYIGVGHSFIKFPRQVQTFEFSKDRSANRGPVSSRTLDGLEVSLEISFQYNLQVENLFKLYNTYGPDYQIVFINIAVDALTEQATKYTAYEFFWDRGTIKDDFQLHLDRIFSSICFANIQFLQLRSVDLPNEFEEAIQVSEVKKQDIKKAEAELNKVSVEVDTRVKAADYQKKVNINIAEGEASALLKQNEANVDSFRKVQSTQTNAYSTMKDSLVLNNKDLLNLIKTKLIKNYDGSNMALNIASPETSSSK